MTSPDLGGAGLAGPAAQTDAQTGAQPNATSAVAQARALADSIGIDPKLFAGREEAATAVMLRLQRFASLSDRDQQNFPGFVQGQGFPVGDPFHNRAVAIRLDFGTNPAWAPGVIPLPVDEKMGERL